MAERTPHHGYLRTTLASAGVASALLFGAPAVAGSEQGVAQPDQSQIALQREVLTPDEADWFVEQTRALKATYTLFSHSADPNYVHLTLPPPLVRYEGQNYVAKDPQGEYAYERLLYMMRVKESGFDPLQIDGGGNDFQHSYHETVSYMGAQGAAQFLPTKWRSSVDEILEGGAEARGYMNWRQVPQIADLGSYRSTGPNSVPPEMQEFVFRNAFTLTPDQWDPFRFALRGDYGPQGVWTVTNFINAENLQQ